MNVLFDLLKILFAFFESAVGMVSADMTFLITWTGYEISGLMSSWAYSISRYGPWAPAVLTVMVGVAIAGLYAVFVLTDAAGAVIA